MFSHSNSFPFHCSCSAAILQRSSHSTPETNGPQLRHRCIASRICGEPVSHSPHRSHPALTHTVLSPRCSHPALTHTVPSPHRSHPALTHTVLSPYYSHPALTHTMLSPRCSHPALTHTVLCLPYMHSLGHFCLAPNMSATEYTKLCVVYSNETGCSLR